jgi:hypothetical protein
MKNIMKEFADKAGCNVRWYASCYSVRREADDEGYH